MVPLNQNQEENTPRALHKTSEQAGNQYCPTRSSVVLATALWAHSLKDPGMGLGCGLGLLRPPPRLLFTDEETERLNNSPMVAMRKSGNWECLKKPVLRPLCELVSVQRSNTPVKQIG